MFLNELKLWNFRRFGSGSDQLDLKRPDLSVLLESGLNLLIGENDSGKTAIIDAIKLVLKTHSTEWIRVDLDDFYKDCSRFRIEAIFKGLDPKEGAHFIEWIGWEGTGEHAVPYLRVILEVSKKGNRILPFDVRSGVDENGHQLTAEARDYLKTTYLKPLRDAQSELIPKKNSRLSQIFSGHEAFKGREKDHLLLGKVLELNEHIKNYFEGKDKDGNPLDPGEQKGKELKTEINRYLKSFTQKSTDFEVSGGDLRSILESLRLLFENERNLGLGSHNLLFISSELLHLNKKDWTGLRLGLIEEIEAHLHPQIQLQVIEQLQDQNGIQLILTTHSPNIASKVHLQNLIICHGGNVFPMGKVYTELESTDYSFLERFLDVTKANLFFAKGIILVEGWAEELMLPVLAKKLGISLTEKGVSVVNLGNTAFLRYCRVFKRKQQPEMEIPVAIITDVDVKPDEYKAIKGDANTEQDVSIADKIAEKAIKYNGQKVKAFISPKWTLEYCIARSPLLQQLFYEGLLKAQLEEKTDKGVQDLQPYQDAIDNVATAFNNWTDPIEQMAFEIYHGKMLKDKISKSITAQHFAKALLDSDVTREQIEGDPMIQYLIEAIKYATTNN